MSELASAVGSPASTILTPQTSDTQLAVLDTFIAYFESFDRKHIMTLMANKN